MTCPRCWLPRHDGACYSQPATGIDWTLTHERCPDCLATAPLGGIMALRHDDGSRWCLGCKARLDACTAEDALVWDTVRRLRASFQPGSCKVLSLGDACPCAKCDADRVVTLMAGRDAARRHAGACEHMIRQHAEAAAIFQPGGRLHERASLPLGKSSVVEGIAWLVAQLDAADARVLDANTRAIRIAWDVANPATRDGCVGPEWYQGALAVHDALWEGES